MHLNDGKRQTTQRCCLAILCMQSRSVYHTSDSRFCTQSSCHKLRIMYYHSGSAACRVQQGFLVKDFVFVQQPHLQSPILYSLEKLNDFAQNLLGRSRKEGPDLRQLLNNSSVLTSNLTCTVDACPLFSMSYQISKPRTIMPTYQLSFQLIMVKNLL